MQQQQQRQRSTASQRALDKALSPPAAPKPYCSICGGPHLEAGPQARALVVHLSQSMQSKHSCLADAAAIASLPKEERPGAACLLVASLPVLASANGQRQDYAVGAVATALRHMQNDAACVLPALEVLLRGQRVRHVGQLQNSSYCHLILIIQVTRSAKTGGFERHDRKHEALGATTAAL